MYKWAQRLHFFIAVVDTLLAAPPIQGGVVQNHEYILSKIKAFIIAGPSFVDIDSWAPRL